MTIDIIIICYEKTPALDRCIKSVKEHTRDYNLIVVEGKRSAAENRNIALSKVKSDWFVMMDDDVIVKPGWLEILLSHRGKNAGQIQPKLLFPDGKIFTAEKVFTTTWGENTVVGMGQEDKGQYDYVRQAELLSGTCGLYNSEILKTCLFDTQYKGSQWEDCDFSMQIRKNGFVLLYCGKTAVYHHNLYREVCEKNSLYFKKKWFGKRELVQRGVLYVGFGCDLDCIFCYYRYKPKEPFRRLSELKRECNSFRKFYGNTHVDISGGEPTIYPHIAQLVEYCRNIDLVPTIITHGQRLSRELVETLKKAGIEDFLVSYHGLEKEHDYLVQKKGGYKAMRQGIENVINAGINFRINTVVTKINYHTLPALVGEFINIKPRGVDLIMFGPWESWLSHPLEDFYGRYTEIAPYLKEAISVLDTAGIKAYASFIPFCLFDGFEKYVMNFPQLCFNNEWGWDFKRGHKLRGEYDYLYYALKESRARFDQGPACKRCSLRLICSGLPKQYAKTVGWNELKPRDGMIVRDPIHFNTEKIEAAPPIAFKQLHFPTSLTESFVATYPWLAKTDPLILHQMVPFEDIKPLQRPGDCQGLGSKFRKLVGRSIRLAGKAIGIEER